MSEHADCSGVCIRASDVDVYVKGDPVAYAHPDCPTHGVSEPQPNEESK